MQMESGTSTAAAATSDGKPITPLLPPAVLDKAANGDGKKKEAAEPSLAPPPSKTEARTFAREFLLGELIKAASLELKIQTLPFGKMTQFQQEAVLTRIKEKCAAAVKETIEIVASDARLTFRADVDSVTFKDGVKVNMKLAKSEHAHTLADKSGSSVLIVVEDFARYMNPGDATKGQPDQPPLFDSSQTAKEAKNKDAATPPKRPPKKKAAAKPSSKSKRR